VVWLDFSGYVQQTPLWSKIPTTMIEKCARVAALRKAYPEAFGGLYIQEEMPPPEPEIVSTSPRAKKIPPPPDDGPNAEELATINAQVYAAISQVTGKPPEPREEEVRVIGGRHKGKAIADLDPVSLAQAIEDIEKTVKDPANEHKKSYPKAMASYAALTAMRDSYASPEPGSNG
jgi:hypothetical protein